MKPKANGWFKTPNCFNREQAKYLSKSGIRLMLELLKYRDNRNGHCSPRISVLAQSMDISQRQVLRALKELESKAMITVIKGKPNRYEFKPVYGDILGPNTKS